MSGQFLTVTGEGLKDDGHFTFQNGSIRNLEHHFDVLSSLLSFKFLICGNVVAVSVFHGFSGRFVHQCRMERIGGTGKQVFAMHCVGERDGSGGLCNLRSIHRGSRADGRNRDI